MVVISDQVTGNQFTSQLSLRTWARRSKIIISDEG